MRQAVLANVPTLLLAASTLFAQAPPAWSALSIPAGIITSNAVSLGKLSTYRDSGVLHVHDAISRQWRTLGLGPSATLRLMNDCLLVQDSSTWTAFSAYRGRFEQLAVSGAAQLLNPGGNNNDSILLVADGTQLHAFSAFVGTWTMRTLAAGFASSVQRHTAVVSQGSLLTAMDAFTGQWHDLSVPTPPTTISANGVAGFAFGPTAVHGFSAVHGTWQTAAPLPNASFVRADDWALLHDATEMLAYSGLRGGFDHLVLGVNSVLATEDLFALVDTPAGALAFSAIEGAFSAPLCPTPSRVSSNGAVALLVEGTNVHAYSAVRNDLATLVLSSTDEGAANVVAYALASPGSQPWLYSAFTGLWYSSPLDVLNGSPLLTTTNALLATTTGAGAFSARTGNFVPLVAPNLILAGNASSAPNIAWNATDIFTFDARRDRWSGLARSSSAPLVVQIWRTTLMAIDGPVVHGFGAQDGTWSTQVLPGPTTSVRANSESGRVTTANQVFGYSPLPELLCFAQFPEFRRVQTVGAPLRLVLPLQATDLAVMGVNPLRPVPLPVPGLGLLQLDLTGLPTTTVLPTPTGEPVTLTYQVPTNPLLIGTQWAFQAAVLPAVQLPWLTGAHAVLLL